MKHLSFISLVLLFSMFTSCQKQKTQLHYINLYSTTITDVKCENLKKSTNLKSIRLSDKENNKLLELFKTLKRTDKETTVDARLFGTIDQDSKKINICMSINFININGEKFYVNNALRNYLMSLTEENNQ